MDEFCAALFFVVVFSYLAFTGIGDFFGNLNVEDEDFMYDCSKSTELTIDQCAALKGNLEDQLPPQILLEVYTPEIKALVERQVFGHNKESK